MKKILCVIAFIFCVFSSYAQEHILYGGVSLNVGINENPEINAYVNCIRPELYVGGNIFAERWFLGIHWNAAILGSFPADDKTKAFDIGFEGVVGPSFRLCLDSANIYLSPGFSFGFSLGEIDSFTYKSRKVDETYFQAFAGFGGEMMFEINSCNPIVFGFRGFYFPLCNTDATVKWEKQKIKVIDYSPRYEFSIFLAVTG